jgi:hypothetical protein
VIKRLPPVRITGEGYDVQTVFELFEEHGALICGLYKMEGHIDLPPKAWLRTVRAHVGQFEELARSAGCAELRIAGRDWSRVLPDYQSMMGDSPNLIFKRL